MSDDNNHISTVRKHLLDQLQALRAASAPDDIERELERSKGVSELAQAVVNTAKVEVDYLKATGQANSQFLGAPAGAPALPPPDKSTHNRTELPAPGNGIASVTRYALKD